MQLERGRKSPRLRMHITDRSCFAEAAIFANRRPVGPATTTN